MNTEQARERITDIRTAGGKVSADELDVLWAALPPVRPEEILGDWRGSAFVTGHYGEGLLAAANWHGKRFHSTTDVQPLICRDADGTLFSNIEAGKGEASLWMAEFRGESTASMVYDGQPIVDHFKQIDDSTLLGVMNGKDVLDDGRYFYFLLERE
ncbi:DUF4334 domain-containing protein [Streptomyces sp. NPDC093707]|uniref:DUF4334 domain-containing protein n=1 Tax=Streptomyces sp. NPDC093707 TaxID=3154984 RepID=UPI0034504043